MDGEAVQIVKISEDEEHTFYLDEEALTRVLCQDEIKDKPVCLLSVAGTLLGFFKKFLKTFNTSSSLCIMRYL